MAIKKKPVDPGELRPGINQTKYKHQYNSNYELEYLDSRGNIVQTKKQAAPLPLKERVEINKIRRTYLRELKAFSLQQLREVRSEARKDLRALTEKVDKKAYKDLLKEAMQEIKDTKKNYGFKATRRAARRSEPKEGTNDNYPNMKTALALIPIKHQVNLNIIQTNQEYKNRAKDYCAKALALVRDQRKEYKGKDPKDRDYGGRKFYLALAKQMSKEAKRLSKISPKQFEGGPQVFKKDIEDLINNSRAKEHFRNELKRVVKEKLADPKTKNPFTRLAYQYQLMKIKNLNVINPKNPNALDKLKENKYVRAASSAADRRKSPITDFSAAITPEAIQNQRLPKEIRDGEKAVKLKAALAAKEGKKRLKEQAATVKAAFKAARSDVVVSAPVVNVKASSSMGGRPLTAVPTTVPSATASVNPKDDLTRFRGELLEAFKKQNPTKSLNDIVKFLKDDNKVKNQGYLGYLKDLQNLLKQKIGIDVPIPKSLQSPAAKSDAVAAQPQQAGSNSQANRLASLSGSLTANAQGSAPKASGAPLVLPGFKQAKAPNDDPAPAADAPDPKVDTKVTSKEDDENNDKRDSYHPI